QSPGGQLTQGQPVASANNTSGPTAYAQGKPSAGNGMRGGPGTQPPPQPTGVAAAAVVRRAQPPTPGYQGPNNNVNANVRAAVPTGAGGGNAMGGLQHSGAP